MLQLCRHRLRFCKEVAGETVPDAHDRAPAHWAGVYERDALDLQPFLVAEAENFTVPGVDFGFEDDLP